MSYATVMRSVEETAHRCGRDPESIRVVVVSKGRSVDQIRELYELGHREFGENRATEMSQKAAALPTDITWHFVGALQTNKVRLVRPITGLLHSLDRRSLALAWLKGHGLPPPVLVQVNLGGEDQKSGVAPDEVQATVEMVFGLGLDVRGLMAIPPVPGTPEESRPHFRTLAALGAQVSSRWPVVSELSMGMTDDYEVAIEEGASMIRVGRAIFESTV